MNFLGTDGDEHAEKLTKRALEDEVSVTELWMRMLSVHVQAQFYSPLHPDDAEDDAAGEVLDLVRKENATKAKPFVPVWLFPMNRGAYVRTPRG